MAEERLVRLGHKQRDGIIITMSDIIRVYMNPKQIIGAVTLKEVAV